MIRCNGRRPRTQPCVERTQKRRRISRIGNRIKRLLQGGEGAGMPAQVDLEATDIDAVPACIPLRPYVADRRLGAGIAMRLSVYVGRPRPGNDLPPRIIPAAAFDPADRHQQPWRQTKACFRRFACPLTRWFHLCSGTGESGDNTSNHQRAAQNVPGSARADGGAAWVVSRHGTVISSVASCPAAVAGRHAKTRTKPASSAPETAVSNGSADQALSVPAQPSMRGGHGIGAAGRDSAAGTSCGTRSV